MVTDEIRNSLKQALTELRIAEYELNRPADDVVSLSVCYSARESMSTMLRLFLLCKATNPIEGACLNDLYNQCKVIDTKFSTVDISSVLCNEMNHTDCDGKYCLSPEKVNECFSIANQFKAIVLSILKINESEM